MEKKSPGRWTNHAWAAGMAVIIAVVLVGSIHIWFGVAYAIVMVILAVVLIRHFGKKE